MSSNITVVVRCRPLNARELARGAIELIKMEGNNTFLEKPQATTGTPSRPNDKLVKSFAFDKSYWSAGSKDDPDYASQEMVYADLGSKLLEHSFEGFNTCIFAYGQTGSGKSYSMMGYGEDRGIIPLICEALFQRISDNTVKDKLSYTVEVSYVEIYQEKVRDLLNPTNKSNLKVREHPTLGPYVEGLAKLVVQSYADVETLMDEGTKARTVAATNMNETSSRSHAIFTLLLTQRRLDTEIGIAGEKVSRISLVDLAGSERANATGATGTRLKEGALINKSLTTLGRVIAALAAASSAGTGKKAMAAADKVPYRDSVLTWLLKDSLGGNSKTAMIAAISPADYEETLSTLRYADQAKKIKNKAVVNEDPNARLIREVKEELTTLRSRMSGASNESTYDVNIPPEQQLVQYLNKAGELTTVTKAELQDQLEASERLMASVTETWEEKLLRTQEIQKERESALEALGITIEKNLIGVHTPKKMPHLVNLNEDPLMSECLIYQIKKGRTVVGNSSCDKPCDIRLSGASILSEHCHFENSDDGVVTIHSRPNSTTIVNGLRISASQPKELRSGFRIILGDFHVFRFNHPEEVRRARDAGKSDLRSPHLGVDDEGTFSTPETRPDSPMSTIENADWSYAHREAVVARLNGTDVELDKLKNEELDQLYFDVLKVRHSRTASSVASTDRPESRMSFLESVTEYGNDGNSSETGSPFRPMSRSTSRSSFGESIATLNQSREMEAAKLEMEEKVRTLELAMVAQKKQYDASIRRREKGKGTEGEEDGEVLDDEQIRLARMVLSKWRSRRRVRMAEDALSSASTIKEANIISRELGKSVSFQLMIVEAEVHASASTALSDLLDIEAVADSSFAHSPKPCVAVKVIDRRNTAVYVWSLPKLRQRLEQMRSLLKFIDKPEYSQHFSWEDPFYESPLPLGGYSFVGTAHCSLALLARNLPSSSIIQITSPYIADPIGSCRIRIKPISVVAPPLASTLPADSTPHQIAPPASDSSSPSPSPFLVGSQVTFEIIVDRVSGLSKQEFAVLHLQIHHTSLFGPTADSDEALPSLAVDLDIESTNDIKLRRTITVEMTQAIHEHFSTSYAPVELFAIVKATHLDKIELWDEAREAATASRIANSPSVRGDPFASDVTRRAENELVVEQFHDVIATVEIHELDSTGEYVAVPVVLVNGVDNGAFFLRQGLQRRIVLKLSHNSGRGWNWQRIVGVSLGDVRSLDSHARIHAAVSLSKNVELVPIKKEIASFAEDGSASLAFAASWDSSLHASSFLNRTTASDHRVLLRLDWQVEAENCGSPVQFSMDIAVTIQGRDARTPTRLTTLLSSVRLSERISGLFAIRLTPGTQSATDIWRVNTSEVFVRGEEILGVNWKPRGLTLIRDHDQYVKEGRKGADVEAIKSLIAAFELTLPSPVGGVSREVRLGKVIELWKVSFGTKDEISLDRGATMDVFNLSEPSPSSLSVPRIAAQPTPKLTGHVTMIPRTDIYSKRGYLSLLHDPSSNEWKKLWFVVRRPYLHLYDDSKETEELMAINLSTIRVEQSPEIEQMLGRKFLFGIYTRNNSYYLQAQSARDLIDWINKIS